jgi:hypothetical protein
VLQETDGRGWMSLCQHLLSLIWKLLVVIVCGACIRGLMRPWGGKHSLSREANASVPLSDCHCINSFGAIVNLWKFTGTPAFFGIVFPE